MWLPVGLLGSVSNRASGLGVELTLDYVGTMLSDVPWRQTVATGLVAQYERLSDGANRFVAAGQVMYVGILGLEAGAVWRRNAAANETGFHLAPFLAFAFISAGCSLDIPLASTGPNTPPIEIALTFTLKFPIPLNGNWPI